ncbi:hypothetical protein T01_12521 [Trichinella spiralis]|uniref:Uncharacterized protein n=1 Tax=Trichinella spiralis TaxID=6334 RepID=A0A0V1BLD0_TRISP|nr:hypothetical protein T01_12521 [Trichinella spiralis]
MNYFHCCVLPHNIVFFIIIWKYEISTAYRLIVQSLQKLIDWRKAVDGKLPKAKREKKGSFIPLVDNSSIPSCETSQLAHFKSEKLKF